MSAVLAQLQSQTCLISSRDHYFTVIYPSVSLSFLKNRELQQMLWLFANASCSISRAAWVQFQQEYYNISAENCNSYPSVKLTIAKPTFKATFHLKTNTICKNNCTL